MSGRLKLWTRRGAGALVLGAAASIAGRALAAESIGTAEQTGRLQARPGAPDAALPPLSPGEAKLEFGDRFALLYVPAAFDPHKPMPLVMFLHGTGGKAKYVMQGWKDIAESHGFILLAPESEVPTWHFRLAPAGDDAALFDNALAHVFARATIDTRHLAFAGKSDGATMAMSVGLANGDLLSHIMFFSGGSVFGSKGIGRPRLFFSHGHQDDILPFDNAVKIADGLKTLGYDVTFFDFKGGHIIPQESADAALAWFLG